MTYEPSSFKKSGFSLIEVIIALFISMIFLLAFSTVLIKAIRSTYELSEKSFAVSEQRTLAQTIEQDMTFGASLEDATSSSYTMQLPDGSVIYTLAEEGGIYELQRTKNDIDGNEIMDTVIVNNILGTEGNPPQFTFYTEDNTELTIPSPVTTAFLDQAEYISLDFQRRILKYNNQTTPEQTVRFKIYNPNE